MGTADPTAVPHAARRPSSGWPPRRPAAGPTIMAANRALALDGRDRLATALGHRAARPGLDDRVDGDAADPGRATDAAAGAARAAARRERIEVPVLGLARRAAARHDPTDPPRLVLLRLSAQRYNEPADFDRLAEAVTAAIR